MLPSSHSSGAWIHPSPHTATASSTDDADDASAEDAGGASDEAASATDDASAEDATGSGGTTDDSAAADDGTGAADGTDDATIGAADDDTTAGAADETAADEAASLATAGSPDATDDPREDDDGGEEETAAADDVGTEDADDVQATIDHLHPPEHSSPSHVGTVQMRPHAGCVLPEPVSHSSPTESVTMPSPHRTFVQFAVQVGPTPFLQTSSHSSPGSSKPLPQLDGAVVCPRKRVAPITATTANSASRTYPARRVSAGKRCSKRTTPILRRSGVSRNRLEQAFLVE